MALLLRPDLVPAPGAFAVRAALAVLAALDDVAPEAGARLKWPNDIMVAGRKAGGILCEARWTGSRLGWVAVGVGLNVGGPVSPDFAQSAIALADVVPGLDRIALLSALVPKLAVMDRRAALLDEMERRRFTEVRAQRADSEGDESLDYDGTLVVTRPDGSVQRRTVPD